MTNEQTIEQKKAELQALKAELQSYDFDENGNPIGADPETYVPLRQRVEELEYELA
jgi:hypothetical protein